MELDLYFLTKKEEIPVKTLTAHVQKYSFKVYA